MSKENIACEKIQFQRQSETKIPEDQYEPSDLRLSAERLMQENTQIKGFLAKELSNLGFSKGAIERILNVRVDRESSTGTFKKGLDQEPERKGHA